MSHEEVIRFAHEAHARHWHNGADVGMGDRMAAAVTKDWQVSVLTAFPGQFISEQRVGNLNERIDLVDIKNGVAYELKVSPNNDHFEFYRDIFKVMVARDNGLPQIKSFCFICPEEAARRYERGLRRAVLAEGERLGLNLSVASL
jgi:hypothetical protein